VSIGATMTSRYLEPHVRNVLPPQLAARLLERTETMHLLSGEEAAQVRRIFGDAYNRQMYLAVGLAAACLPAAAMAWSRQGRVETPSTEKIEVNNHRTSMADS
jgi:hypothetical protein